MRASRDQNLSQAFVLTEGELQRLIDSIAPHFPKLRTSAKCADGIDRTFDNLVELVRYENSPKRAIRTIRLHGSSDDWKSTFSLRLDDDDERNIRVSIEADEPIVLAMSERIEERLSSMRPWYNWIARTSAFWWFFVPYWIFLVILPAVRTWRQGKPIFPESWDAPAAVYVLSVIFGAAVWLLVGVLSRFKRRYFPMAVFAVGQGIKRHHDRDLVRNVVIVSFVVSVLAGFVSSGLS